MGAPLDVFYRPLRRCRLHQLEKNATCGPLCPFSAVLRTPVLSSPIKGIFSPDLANIPMPCLPYL